MSKIIQQSDGTYDASVPNPRDLNGGCFEMTGFDSVEAAREWMISRGEGHAADIIPTPAPSRRVSSPTGIVSSENFGRPVGIGSPAPTSVDAGATSNQKIAEATEKKPEVAAVSIVRASARSRSGSRVKTYSGAPLPTSIANKFSEAEFNEMEEQFKLFDSDNSGAIDKQELIQVLTNLTPEGEKLPDEETLTKMIKEVDTDDSGDIDFSEFVVMMYNVKYKHAKYSFANVVASSKMLTVPKMCRWIYEDDMLSAFKYPWSWSMEKVRAEKATRKQWMEFPVHMQTDFSI